MDTSPSPPPGPPRTFWQRRIRDPIVAQLTQGISPEKIALTLAVGGALALFPILGTTTGLCFLAAWLLRLNQPLIHLLNQALFPVHIPAIYGCIRLGEYLFKVEHAPFNIRHMNGLFWSDPGRLFRDFGESIFHACVAWGALTPLFVAFIYFGTLPLLRRIAHARHNHEEKIHSIH